MQIAATLVKGKARIQFGTSKVSRARVFSAFEGILSSGVRRRAIKSLI